MKIYQVFYWIKKDRKEYLNHIFVSARNSKEACSKCKKLVFERTKRNAFRPTTKPYSEDELNVLKKNPNFIVD